MAKKASETEDGMLASIYDWGVQIERTHGVRVRIVMNLSKTPGRMNYRVEGCHASGDRLIGVVVQERGVYPNGDNISLAGAFLKALLVLDRLLEESKNFMNSSS